MTRIAVLLLLALIGSVTPAWSQGTVAPIARSCYYDDDGTPLVGGDLTFYSAGTTTIVTIYTTEALAVAADNPITLDAYGCATVFLAAGSYKIRLRDASDVQIFSIDGVHSYAAANTNTDVTVTAGETWSAGTVVFLSDGTGGRTAGSWYKTDADTAAMSITADEIGITLDATNVAGGDTTGSIRLAGRVTGLSALTVGDAYYISATAGALTATAPTFSRYVGMADTTTSLIIGTAPYQSSAPTFWNVTSLGRFTISAETAGTAASLYRTAQDGLVSRGVTGSVNDWLMENGVGTDVVWNSTGTTTVRFAGDVHLNNGALTVAGTADVFGSTLTINNAHPILVWDESDQAGDEQIWRARSQGKSFIFETANDALDTTAPVFTVVRGAGTAITSVTFTPVTQFADRITFSANTATTAAGSISKTATNGLKLTAATGSGNDFNLLNPGETLSILRVPTGTNNIVAAGNVEITGTGTISSTATMAAQVLKTGVISPAAVCSGASCNVADWAPTGLSGAYVINLDCGAGGGNVCTLQGITGGTAGRELLLIYSGGAGNPTLTIANSAGGANQIVTTTGADITGLVATKSVLLRYIASSWYVIGGKH